MKENIENASINNIVILGSTGSIGKQALEVVDKHPQRFRVIALSARDEVPLLQEQVQKYNPLAVAVSDSKAYLQLKEGIGDQCRVVESIEGMCELCSLPQVDTVLVAVSGAVGIKPTLAAIKAHKRIALANKETLVAAGDIVMRSAR